jgi:hypothetical protein
MPSPIYLGRDNSRIANLPPQWSVVNHSAAIAALALAIVIASGLPPGTRQFDQTRHNNNV